MSVLTTIGTIFSGLTKPLSDAYSAYIARKAAKDTAEAKLKMAKQSGDFDIKLSDAEWEAISKRNESGTWKDEYVTLIITSPFVLLFVSAVLSAWTGDPRYIESAKAGIEALKNLGVDLGDLMAVVVVAAVSMKGIGAIKK
ncbi:hypothetical protein [Terasakiella pusilla]|uniref:hypothetical protein n=1 Tax=Terasakiella pusilla TaxID=64973 RepID=UPI003AA8A397